MKTLLALVALFAFVPSPNLFAAEVQYSCKIKAHYAARHAQGDVEVIDFGIIPLNSPTVRNHGNLTLFLNVSRGDTAPLLSLYVAEKSKDELYEYDDIAKAGSYIPVFQGAEEKRVIELVIRNPESPGTPSRIHYWVDCSAK